MDISYSNTMIYSGHIDGHVRIWDIRAKRMINNITHLHDEIITSVTTSPREN